MPTAALSQMPVGSAAPADTDVEAPPFVAFHTGIDQRQRADDAPTAAAGGAEAETAPVGGNGGGASAAASSLSSVRRQGSDFPLFALGFAALVSKKSFCCRQSTVRLKAEIWKWSTSM